MNIDQIMEMLKQISDEVARMKTTSDQADASIDDERKLAKIADKYPIARHVLTRCEENIRYDYIALLISLFNKKADEQLRRQRMLLIYRMVASYEKDIDLSEYITKSMKVDLSDWDALSTTLDAETLFCFAVDILILGMYDVSSSKRKKYEEISDVLQFLRLGRIEPSDNINYSNFIGYFENIPYTSIVNDMEKAKKLAGRVLIVNVKVSDYEEIIDLNEFLAEEICFKGCLFEHIRGMRSDGKRVLFEQCTFEGNIFNKDSNRMFFGNSEKWEKGYVFIAGSNFKFIKLKFLNCNVSKSLLEVKNTEMRECEFVNCKGYEFPCTYLIAMKEGKIENCKFTSCYIETDNESRSNTYGGIVYIENGNVYNCEFGQCKAYGNSSYGSCAVTAKYAMQIIRAKNSKVTESVFSHCCCASVDSSYWQSGTNYIVGITNSVEENNEFSDCKSYQYFQSDRKSSYNVGNV